MKRKELSGNRQERKLGTHAGLPLTVYSASASPTRWRLARRVCLPRTCAFNSLALEVAAMSRQPSVQRFWGGGRQSPSQVVTRYLKEIQMVLPQNSRWRIILRCHRCPAHEGARPRWPWHIKLGWCPHSKYRCNFRLLSASFSVSSGRSNASSGRVG
jgi:hypothetical protein